MPSHLGASKNHAIFCGAVKVAAATAENRAILVHSGWEGARRPRASGSFPHFPEFPQAPPEVPNSSHCGFKLGGTAAILFIPRDTCSDCTSKLVHVFSTVCKLGAL